MYSKQHESLRCSERYAPLQIYGLEFNQYKFYGGVQASKSDMQEISTFNTQVSIVDVR